MKAALQRFTIQIEKVEKLLKQSEHQENPALWLYLNDLRTPIFQLEGLSRLYANVHNKKTFEKLLNQFKDLEDILGKLDYYAAFTKEFKGYKIIPQIVKDYFKKKTSYAISDLNWLLHKENWLNGKRVQKIRSRLKDINWFDPKEEAAEIKTEYNSEIDEILKFLKGVDYRFDNLEEDVHELRRKLRWLSIYAGALNGLVQLTPPQKPKTALKKYQTKEVLASPFNTLPPLPQDVVPVYIYNENFYAWSFVISKLGELKDAGLRIKALQDAIQETELLKDSMANEKAMKILGKNQATMEHLLEQASALIKDFIDAGSLENIFKV